MKDAPHFDPIVLEDKWCIDADSNPPKFIAAVVYVFRTTYRTLTMKVIRPSPELAEFQKDEARRYFRYALINPEKCRDENYYYVT